MAAAPRNPSAAHAGVYDYTTRTHMSIYNSNTESLYSDKDSQYGLEPEDLQSFMLLLDARVQSSNWKDMLTYQAVNQQGVLQPMYLVTHYGEVPGLTVRAAAIAYLTAGGRMSQDSEQLYQCIRKSLTKAALSRVMNEQEKFMVIIAGTSLTDGPLFLLTVVSLAYTNTRSMSSVYRNRLSMLTQKMQSIPNSDVKVFNAYVKSMVELLAAGGEKCEDLAWNLLRAYKATGDAKFTNYIEQKEDAWKDGTINWGANGNDLMMLAENYYKDALINETWLVASAEQERIIALEAQIKAFKPHVSTNDKKGTKRDTKKNDRDRKWPKWKDVAPKANAAKTMTKDGTTYHWCIHHARWTVHKPDECNLAAASSVQVSAEATEQQVDAPRARRQTAMTTVTEDSDTDSNGYDTADNDSDSNN